MTEFKSICRSAIPVALEKAERYRLLNEPNQAESICRDILDVEPENQGALLTLLLSLTEQFRSESPECFTEAIDIIPRIESEYERHYFTGLIWERRAISRLDQTQFVATSVYECIRRALDAYEQAEQIRPDNNDDALLRWNSCQRLCERYHLHAEREEMLEPIFGED